MPSRRFLQKCAIAISIISLFYNTAEGVVSIVFGAESSSRALVFYGIQSAVEVISDLLVTWRFLTVSGPGDEADRLTPRTIRIERIATTIIGVLLASLTLAGVSTSAASIIAHEHPSTTLPALIIAAASIAICIVLYGIKRYLARALQSSVLHGEAVCTLCCTQLSVVLLIGSLIYRVWKGGWWVDSATSIVIALIFGWEGVKMIRWARNESFDGGCCQGCQPKKGEEPACTTACAQGGKSACAMTCAQAKKPACTTTCAQGEKPACTKSCGQAEKPACTTTCGQAKKPTCTTSCAQAEKPACTTACAQVGKPACATMCAQVEKPACTKTCAQVEKPAEPEQRSPCSSASTTQCCGCSKKADKPVGSEQV